MEIKKRTLYVVGTPLGNLGDLSPRGEEILRGADFIAAEDTRVTLRLLNCFGIKRELVSCREHNERAVGAKIAERLLRGQSCALVTDAGLPAISDPGTEVVRLCRERGIEVVSVPGASALTAALSVSGMAAGRFCFEGFLSTSSSGRRKHLAELKGETRVMVFYEAPHKLTRTLADMLEAFGDREIAVVRELTKLHEETRRTTLARAVSEITEPRGEYVLVVAGAERREPEITLEEAAELARGFGEAPSAAAKRAAAETGIARSEIYKALIGKKT